MWRPTHPLDRLTQAQLPPERDQLLGLLGWCVEQGLVQDASVALRALVLGGLGPTELMLWVARFDAERAPYGSRVLALAGLCGALALGQRGPRLGQVLLQPLELLSATPRLPARAPVAALPVELPLFDAQLHTAVEARDAARAQGLLRGAAGQGWGRAAIEGALLGACADHCLVGLLPQVIAVFDVLEGANAQSRAQVLAGLGRALALASRADDSPVWSAWTRRVAPLNLAALHRASITGAPAWFDRGALLAALGQGEPERCLRAWVLALSQGVPLPDLVDVLSLGASARLMAMDLAAEFDPDRPGWAPTSQLLVDVAALRQATERWHDARVVRLLLQLVWRISLASVQESAPVGLRSPLQGGVPELLQAASGWDMERASAIALTLPVGELGDAVLVLGLKDSAALPRSSASRLLTSMAALRESQSLDPSEARAPLMAALRMLSAPRRERELTGMVRGEWGP